MGGYRRGANHGATADHARAKAPLKHPATTDLRPAYAVKLIATATTTDTASQNPAAIDDAPDATIQSVAIAATANPADTGQCHIPSDDAPIAITDANAANTNTTTDAPAPPNTVAVVTRLSPRSNCSSRISVNSRYTASASAPTNVPAAIESGSPPTNIDTINIGSTTAPAGNATSINRGLHRGISTSINAITTSDTSAQRPAPGATNSNTTDSTAANPPNNARAVSSPSTSADPRERCNANRRIPLNRTFFKSTAAK